MSRVATPLRKNDNVLVITGKDRGKKGRILKVVPSKNGKVRLIVEGVAGLALLKELLRLRDSFRDFGPVQHGW